MNHISKLAIIIPAIKLEYFESTLESLSKQTCKDFVVYVGDDCSGKDFKSLCKKYENEFSIVYKCFDDNLGSYDLVGQWKRCVDISLEEEWLWLFSDDDIIGEKCVELFYKEIIECKKKYPIYHFNVKIIDENGQVIKEPKEFPELITSIDFYKKKSSAELDSFVVEYIFSRTAYNEVGGFQRFDMAWGSDIATWIKMGNKDGIKTLNGDFVYWRQSNNNITPNHKKEIVFRKLNIDIEFLSWVNNFFGKKSILLYNQYVLFRLLFFYSLILDRYQVNLILSDALAIKVLNSMCYYLLKFLYPIVPVLKYIKSHFYDNKK